MSGLENILGLFHYYQTNTLTEISASLHYMNATSLINQSIYWSCLDWLHVKAASDPEINSGKLEWII